VVKKETCWFFCKKICGSAHTVNLHGGTLKGGCKGRRCY